MKFENESCPVCGEGEWVHHSDGIHTFSHKKKLHSVSGMHYAQCSHCETRGFIKGQIAENKRRIAEYEAELRDYISPSNILRIRERYDISQKDAAKIFNCGPTQFSKWERGIVAPTGATAILLRKALSSQQLMVELAKDAEVFIKPAKIKDAPPQEKMETHLANSEMSERLHWDIAAQDSYLEFSNQLTATKISHTQKQHVSAEASFHVISQNDVGAMDRAWLDSKRLSVLP